MVNHCPAPLLADELAQMGERARQAGQLWLAAHLELCAVAVEEHFELEMCSKAEQGWKLIVKRDP